MTIEMDIIFESQEFDDGKLLNAYASCFDRPEFTTPFNQESDLFHFKKAITNTIEALLTGVHRLGDGTIINRFLSINEITDSNIRHSLKDIVVDLQKLRSTYDSFLKSEKSCYGKNNCHVHILSPPICHEIDLLRINIINKFKNIYPKFNISIW